MKNRKTVEMREFADFPDSLGSPLHSVETFGILFSSVSFRPACSFTVFRRSQNKARPQMRISAAILAVLAFVAAPMAADASLVTIDATLLTEGQSMTSYEYATGKFASFTQADGSTNVVITDKNAYFVDAGEAPSPGSWSGDREFGVNEDVESVGTLYDPPYASIWINLQLGLPDADSETISEVLSSIGAFQQKQILRVDFSEGLDNVTVDFSLRPNSYNNPFDSNDTTFGFFAFDENGDYLGRITQETDDALPLSLTFSWGSSAIRTLLVGGSASDSSVTVGVTGLSFDIEDDVPPPVVPEPASAALALFGLAGAFLGRRRLMVAA